MANREFGTIGTAEELKRMVRLGDLIRIEFKGRFSEDGLQWAEGVINYTVKDGVCEVLVDEGEKRLGPLCALLAQEGATLGRVNLQETDLEDVFVEFAKGSGFEEVD